MFLPVLSPILSQMLQMVSVAASSALTWQKEKEGCHVGKGLLTLIDQRCLGLDE